MKTSNGNNKNISEEILKEYLKLLRMRESGISGTRHEVQYLNLKHLVLCNQDSLIELLCSGKLPERGIVELMSFGGHGGSVKKEYNEEWHPFMKELRKHREKLPEVAQDYTFWTSTYPKYAR